MDTHQKVLEKNPGSITILQSQRQNGIMFVLLILVVGEKGRLYAHTFEIGLRLAIV